MPQPLRFLRRLRRAGVQTTTLNSQKTAKRKAKPTSDLVAPKKPKKFAWSPEVAEVLLKYVKEFKTQCEYKAIDFEADLASLYTEVRRCMAIDFPEGFGPESVSEPGKDIKDMDASEYKEYRKELEAQKAKIRSGYQRIKEKIKSVRQDYRNAVNKGTRSGSGKIVQDNYDPLTDIWGGSPSTTSLSFGIDGDTISLNSGDEQEDQPEISEGIIIIIIKRDLYSAFYHKSSKALYKSLFIIIIIITQHA